jgi:hypothetical protein
VLLLIIGSIFFAFMTAMFCLVLLFGFPSPGAGQNRSAALVFGKTAPAREHHDPDACAGCIKACEAIPQAQSYVPAELQHILVCITIQFNVSSRSTAAAALFRSMYHHGIPWVQATARHRYIGKIMGACCIAGCKNVTLGDYAT